MIDLASPAGIAAAACSMTSFAPQAWRIIRTRETEGISPPMYMLTVAAFGLWLAYGWLRRDWPLVAANATCFALSSFILFMTLLPLRRRRSVAARLDPTDESDGEPTPATAPRK